MTTLALTEQQKDGLTELINIAFARTASSLSELTGHRVLLDVPELVVCPISELADALADFSGGEVASVHQIFTGPVAGDALLVLNYEGATMLVDLLSEGPGRPARLDASAREVLAEVGNILLNSCLGMFGNLLQVHVSFSVPRLHLEALHGLVDSLVIAKDEVRYALVAKTAFHLRDCTVSGHLVMVLGVSSLDQLLQAIARMG